MADKYVRLSDRKHRFHRFRRYSKCIPNVFIIYKTSEHTFGELSGHSVWNSPRRLLNLFIFSLVEVRNLIINSWLMMWLPGRPTVLSTRCQVAYRHLLPFTRFYSPASLKTSLLRLRKPRACARSRFPPIPPFSIRSAHAGRLLRSFVLVCWFWVGVTVVWCGAICLQQ